VVENFYFVTQLLNIDKDFKQVSNSDFDITSQNMTTTVASVTTREIQEIDSPFNDFFMTVDIPDAYRVDAKSFIERPFFVDEITFPDTAARYTLLTSSVRFLPGDIARSNDSVLNMFKMAAYGRPDLMINVSMAGTITHAGCVLVGVLPPFPTYPNLVGTNNASLINTILSGPHAFLHANEATSVAIPVPWYCNTDLATTDMEQTQGYDTTLDITVTNGNYATLVYLVLNPLQPSTGSSKSLRIIVEACFKNFDLAVPTPRFVSWTAQSGRTMFNPNYEEFDKLAAQYGIEEWINAPPKKRHRLLHRLTKYAPYVGGVASVMVILLRVGFACMAGEDPLPMDFIPTPPNWEPQTGIIDGFKNIATGLFDSAANGLKTAAADAIDVGRGVIREYTGLYNPNIPQVQERVITTATNFVNNTDVPQFFEKLDPFVKFNRIVKEPIFGSNIDEMAIANIVTKKQHIGSFKVDVNDGVGVMKWARPISPFQGGNGVANPDDSITCYNNLELLHSFSRGWRGPMKLTIQSVMNNKQQCKLKVVKMYNPSVKITSQYPVYKSVVNAPTHLLEFTQGGQEHEVSLPYLCRNDITPCATNMDTEAMFHGIYYIYVAQPLVVSDSSPTSVEFNIYLAGEPDLTFYGYTTATTYHSSYGVLPQPGSKELVATNKKGSPISKRPYVSVTRFQPNIAFYKYAPDVDTTMAAIYVNSSKIKEKDRTKWDDAQRKHFEAYKNTNKEAYDIILDNYNSVKDLFGDRLSEVIKNWKFNAEHKCTEVEVSRLKTHEIIRLKRIMMVHEHDNFVPQSGTVKVMNEPQKQSHTTRVDDKEPSLSHMTRLMPTLDIRHFLRRMYKSQVYEATADPNTTSNVFLPLSSFLGEDPSLWNYTPIETFSRMYYGKSPGFKFRVMVTITNITSETVSDVDLLNLRIYYIPQNLNAIVNSKVITAAPPNPNTFTSPFSPTDGIPLPFQIIGKESNKVHVVYEFAVPDTSFYKFMGGPNKFYSFSGTSNPPSLAQTDFGTIALQFTNLSRVFPAHFTSELFVGLTDESRFGYHTLAPPFVVYKAGATYSGTNLSNNAAATATRNPFIYRGGYL
jgi:hypothetical protein